MKNAKGFKSLDEIEQKKLLEEFERSIKEKFEDEYTDRINSIQSSLLGTLRQILHISGIGAIIDGACSGSGLVIDEAIKSIQNGDNDVCIVSAVLGNMIVTGNIGFAKIGGLSKKNGSRPLDYTADGLVPGEGAGSLILKDLGKAIDDKDTIFAVIRGSGVSSDGKGQSIYAPSSKGQLKAMQKSLRRSGLKETDIDYIETHATGTMVGDKIEIETIKEFFKGVSKDEHSVALGSIKSQIGHSFSAAGMANIIKVIEGIRHNQMPPTHNFTKLPEGVSLEGTPLYVNTERKEWKVKSKDTPKRAMVNAFGFGGINANVLIEEFIPSYHKAITRNGFYKRQDIAIVGVGSYDFSASNAKDWHKGVAEGNLPQSTKLPGIRWNETVGELNADVKGHFIEKIDFPFIKFRIPPKTLNQIDRSQQIGLIAADEAIKDYGMEKFSGNATGVYVGSMLGLEAAIKSDLRIRSAEYSDALKNTESFKRLSDSEQKSIQDEIVHHFKEYLPKIEEDTLPGYMDNIIAGRISNFYDFDGANEVCDCDLISFTAALYQAANSLYSEENELAVVGGINANMSPEALGLIKKYLNYAKPDEVKDVLPAEGAVFFVLKKCSDITSDDKVYAVIRDIEYLNEVTDQGNKNMDGTCPNWRNLSYLGAEEGFRLLNTIFSKNKSGNNYCVEQIGSSIYGNGMKITVCGSEYKEIELQEEEIHTIYMGGNTKEALFERNFDEQNVPTDFLDYKYRAAILYRSEEELVNKMQLLRKHIIEEK